MVVVADAVGGYLKYVVTFDQKQASAFCDIFKYFVI